MIAALYVARNGAYWDLPGVDPWDEARDARKYNGPWPVVAHSPCQRWGRKPTWLYACMTDLPELDWGESKPQYDPAVVARMGLKRAKRLGEVGARGGGTNSKPRISTPEPFRDILIAMARSAA